MLFERIEWHKQTESRGNVLLPNWQAKDRAYSEASERMTSRADFQGLYRIFLWFILASCLVNLLVFSSSQSLFCSIYVLQVKSFKSSEGTVVCASHPEVPVGVYTRTEVFVEAPEFWDPTTVVVNANIVKIRNTGRSLEIYVTDTVVRLIAIGCSVLLFWKRNPSNIGGKKEDVAKKKS
jgi:hypothetical protein